MHNLVDVSDIFYFFFIFSAPGRQRKVRGDREGGGSVFLLKIPGGGVSHERVGGGEGATRVSAGNLGELGEGGVNIFFRGRNARQDKASALPPYRFLARKRKREGCAPDTLPQEGGFTRCNVTP